MIKKRPSERISQSPSARENVVVPGLQFGVSVENLITNNSTHRHCYIYLKLHTTGYFSRCFMARITTLSVL
jgi:hypothetical protein